MHSDCIQCPTSHGSFPFEYDVCVTLSKHVVIASLLYWNQTHTWDSPVVWFFLHTHIIQFSITSILLLPTYFVQQRRVS